MRVLTFCAILAAIVVTAASLVIMGWPWGVVFALGGCALLWWEWRDLSNHDYDESWRP